MKKFLKGLGIAVALFLALLFILPIFFKDKVKDVALSVANDILNAEVYMQDFDLSFFANFPNASITAENFGVKLKEPFEGDTLANVGELTVVVNLSSLFTGQYEVNSVMLKDVNAKAVVLPDGKANWGIVKSDTTATAEEEPADTSSSPFALALEKVVIENLSATYDDQQSAMKASADGLNLTMKGDIALDAATLANIDALKLGIASVSYSDSTGAGANVKDINLDFSGKVSDAISAIKAKLGIDGVTVKMGAVNYLTDAKVDADINVEADLENTKFTFGENNVKLNEIALAFEGFVQMIDTAMDMDVRLKTEKIDFKEILSLIPAIYKDDFKSLKTEGTVALKADAKGKMVGDTLPAFNASVRIDNAMFKYPDLPSDVRNINVSVRAASEGGTADRVVVNVDTFAFNMAGNPFSVGATLKTPISDPDFAVKAKGMLDFGKLSEVVHIDGTKMNGKLNADIAASGLLSYVDKEQYDKFNVDGELGIAGFNMNMQDLSFPITIDKADMKFSTQNVGVSADVKLGKSDLAVSGKLSRFIQFALRGEELQGELNLKSNFIGVAELMGNSEEDAQKEPDATATESDAPLVIPSNINFAMNADLKKIDYDGIIISNTTAKFTLKNAIARIATLKGETMEGTFDMSGNFNGQDSLRPKLDANLNVKEMSLSEVFTKVKTAKSIVPMFSDAKGKFSMEMELNTVINGSDLSPVLSTVNAKGKFKSKDIGLTSVPALNTIADKVNFDALKNPQLKDLNVAFKIEDGKLNIDPFETVVSNSIVNFSGWSGLDKTLGYVAKITLPKALDKKVSDVVGALGFDVNIGGTFSSPKVTVSVASVTDNLKNKATEAVNNVKEKVNAEVEKQKQKLIDEAQRQRDKLVSEAKSAGDKLVSEAEKQSAKLQKDAKNPIEKAAKKKAGEKLVSEAKSKRNKLVSEAEKNGDKLVNEAKAKASKLK